MTDADDDLDRFLAGLNPREHEAIIRRAKGMLPPSCKGKWGHPHFPQKGWKCIELYDLAEGNDKFSEDDMIVCEMCEGQRLRYVYVMQHPDVPEKLMVGVTCAQHMELTFAPPRSLTSRRRVISK